MDEALVDPIYQSVGCLCIDIIIWMELAVIDKMPKELLEL